MINFLINNTHLDFGSLLLFFIATMGLTNILVVGKIMDVVGLRSWLKENLSADWYGMLECYECTGFWSGLLCGICLISYNPFILLTCGWAGSICSGMYQTLNMFIESKVEFVLNDEVEDESSGK